MKQNYNKQLHFIEKLMANFKILAIFSNKSPYLGKIYDLEPKVKICTQLRYIANFGHCSTMSKI